MYNRFKFLYIKTLSCIVHMRIDLTVCNIVLGENFALIRYVCCFVFAGKAIANKIYIFIKYKNQIIIIPDVAQMLYIIYKSFVFARAFGFYLFILLPSLAFERQYNCVLVLYMRLDCILCLLLRYLQPSYCKPLCAIHRKTVTIWTELYMCFMCLFFALNVIDANCNIERYMCA